MIKSSPSLHFLSLQIMSSSEFPHGKSPRKQLQGSRPPPLKISKDSGKIKKPPLPPPQPNNRPKPPVIIYTVSPRVINVHPKDFKALVQRLTGMRSSGEASSSGAANAGDEASAAAHYATVEKANVSLEKKRHQRIREDLRGIAGLETGLGLEKLPHLPAGVLSLPPAFLPPISSNLFAPVPADSSPFGYLFQDPSLVNPPHVLNANFTGEDSSMISMPSSSNFMPNPPYTYPSNSYFFNNFPEFD